MSEKYQEGSQECLSEISAPIFPKYESVDRLVAAVYLLVGYLFIYVFSSYEFERNLALFTVCYGVVVLLCLYGKGIRPAKESWFWLAVMLAIGIPYAFWSVLYILQVLALMAVAAYWTLCACGRLLEKDRTSQWVFFDGWNALVTVPFCNFGCQLRVLFHSSVREEAQNNHSGRISGIALGIVLALPLLVIILPLLSSADAGFQHLAGNLASYITEHLLTIFLRMLFAIPVSLYLFGLIFGGIYGRNTDRIHVENLVKMGKGIKMIPDTAVCTALTVICLVYCLFIGLQGQYLFSAFAGIRPEGLTYAEYARRGFFELCQIGLWNLVFVSLAGGFAKTDPKEHGGLRFLITLLSVLTLLLIVTAVSKMGMYIDVYGLTVLRILPLIFMLWMGVVFACIIIRQKKEFPMVRICVMAGAVMFCLICVCPIEQWADLYNDWAFARGLIV
ncbi:MAG: DUF4173 domain-containing protein [Lachnospiraceae bacterium]|nr:DUF4173 domain-containing protein [Lachnospiraceae bacterium]